MIELAPSILSADFGGLAEQVSDVLRWGVKRIHCDIMDGHFVPNISFGPSVVEVVSPLARQSGALVEVHLMISEPQRYLEDYVRAGGNVILVHVETCPHLHRTVQMIHQLGAAAGVVVNPATPLTSLNEILSDIDQVLVMTVNPGFGGQEFIPQSLDKIRRLRTMLRERHLLDIPIEVDGGVHVATIRGAQEAGANIAVAGSAVFNKDRSPGENLDALQAACRE
jgi:ribulose-phosphate 3-epimerase